MAHIYDNVDLEWVWSGDFVPYDGDLSDTTDDYLKSLLQDIHTVCASELQDWELYPGLAGGLGEFIGKPNSKSTGDLIHDRLKVAITSLGVVAEEDLNIRVIPVHIHKVLIIIRVNAVATPWNSLADGQLLVTQFVFDFIEQGITFFEKPPQLTRSDY